MKLKLKKNLKTRIKRMFCTTVSLLLLLSSTMVASANDDEFARQFAEDVGISYPIEFTVPGVDPSAPQPRGAIDGGSFYIRNKRTGKYLTAESSGNVIVSDYTGADNQKWDMTNLDNMWFTLRPRSWPSNHYLDVDGTHSFNAALDTFRQNGTNVHIYDNKSTVYNASRWAASAAYDETGGNNLYILIAKRSYCFEWYGNGKYEEYSMDTWKQLTCNDDTTNNVIQHSSYSWANGSSHWYFERITSRYAGTIDNIGTDYIGGWAYDTIDNSNPLTIRFEVKNNTTSAVYKINNVPANLYRSDLAAIGMGDRAYHYLVDWNYFPNGTYTVKMFVGDELVGNAYTVTFTGHDSENAYYGSLGWMYPLQSGKVTDRNLTAPFAESKHYTSLNPHTGIDIGGEYAKEQPIYSPFSGTVVETGYNSSSGYKIVIESDAYVYGSTTKLKVILQHMQNPVSFEENQRIEQNTVVGYVGTTGNSTGYHLHISVTKNGSNDTSWSTQDEFYKKFANPRMFFQNIYFYSISDGFAVKSVKGNCDSEFMP